MTVEEGKPGSALVVGAGIVGVCAALELQRRGLSVAIVDRLDPAEACSFGNAGILAAQAVVPLALPGIHKKVPGMLLDPEGPLVVRRRGWTRTLPWVWKLLQGARAEQIGPRADAMKSLYATTVELHESLAREAGVPELIVPGRYLYLYKRREAVDVDKELSWRLRRERGSEIEVFDGNGAIRELEPAVSSIYQRAVRLGPSARTTNPYRLTRAYADLFRRKGGEIRRAEVRTIAPGSPVALETSSGRMQAAMLVVAGGSWSMRLLEPLGVRFPLIAERGYHMTFADPGVTLTHMCNDTDRHVAVTSMEMGLRVAGTEELGDPDDAPSWRRADVMRAIAAEMLPHAALAKGSRWMGPRPGTPDGIPAIGAVPGHPNILVGFGHGHLGLTGGPATGRLLAQLATGDRPNIDLAPFRLDRFARGRRATGT